MRILVTGGKGMLGWAIQQAFKGHELLMPGSTELDVRDLKQVKGYFFRKPDLVIHAAAETDHTAAEFDPANTYMVNHTGTFNMILFALTLRIPIVYISTCGIFDGKKRSYPEDDTPQPLNHYGMSKLFGEIAVDFYDKNYIFRCGWGMGGGPGIDKKFISKIYQQIKLGSKRILAISDVYGSPTYQVDFARTIRNFVEAKAPYGIYNCGGERASRYEVAKEFVAALGLAKKVKVVPISFKDYNALYPAPVKYTKCEVLDMTKTNKTGLSAMRPWKEALREYAKLWKKS